MLKKIIPHICIILSLIILTLFILDQFNPGMNFLGNDIAKITIAVYCVATLITSFFLALQNRKNY